MSADAQRWGFATARKIIEGAAWIAFAVAAFALTYGFDDPLPMFALGAAFWPRVVLIGIFVTAVVVVLGGLLAKERNGANPSASVEPEQEIQSLATLDPRARGRVSLIFLVPVVYVYAMHKLGFLLVTPFFLAAYMYIFGVRHWRRLLAIAGGVYATVVLIFVKLIFTPLPQGAGFFYTVNGYLLGLIQ
jgi:putative tricarboxylic transport membrane protein